MVRVLFPQPLPQRPPEFGFGAARQGKDWKWDIDENYLFRTAEKVSKANGRVCMRIVSSPALTIDLLVRFVTVSSPNRHKTVIFFLYIEIMSEQRCSR